MLDDWQTYRLEDFIPVTPEVYWRLVERINETFWPLHVLAVALGLTALLLALRGNTRIALVLLAPAWMSSGIVFHLTYYAELNWAAPYFGWAFLAQAALLLGIGAITGSNKARNHPGNAVLWIGTTIATGALIAYPLIATTLGPGASHSETYGLHPEPTAIATLGILLITLRGVFAWLAIPIPFLWCLIGTLTLISLEAYWAALPLAAAVVVIATLAVRPGRPAS